MTRLYIAEKPELAKAIADTLGQAIKRDGYYDCANGDKVTWCYGHMLALCDPEDYNPEHKTWRLTDLPIVNIPWRYKPLDSGKAQLKKIGALIRGAEHIVHAGDPDEEGQLLVDEVLWHFGITDQHSVGRVLISDLNQVARALADERDNRAFSGLSDRALARSVGDQVYGYNLTRGYTLALKAAGHSGVFSVGRVQTPVLGLVVRRDRQREDHREAHYYSVQGDVSVSGLAVSANWQPGDDDPVDDKGRLLSDTVAKAVKTACEGQSLTVAEVQVKDGEASAPLPYNLLTLQADAERKFGLSPARTLEVTQKLRERHRLITYNRSDCQYLSDEHHPLAPAVMVAIGKTASVFAGVIERADLAIRSRAFNSGNVTAHHAIIPTETHADFDQLSEAEQQIYQLVARQYLAQFYPKQQFRKVQALLDCQGQRYRVSSRTVLSPGWLTLYLNDLDNEDAHDEKVDTELDLSGWQVGDQGRCEAIRVARNKTRPLPYYTEGTLLKDLARVAKYVDDPAIKALLKAKDAGKKGEYGGIGTPATRSAIVDGLRERGYIESCGRGGKSIRSTEKARTFHDLLPDAATHPDMTALWHEQQVRIEAGELTVDAFLSGLTGFVGEQIQILGAVTAQAAEQSKLPVCPRCNSGRLSQRQSKHRPFWGCSAYPGCDATYPDKAGAPDFTPRARPQVSDHACPKCGKELVSRPSVKGTWWGCSGFPKCRFRCADQAGQPALPASADAPA